MVAISSSCRLSVQFAVRIRVRLGRGSVESTGPPLVGGRVLGKFELDLLVDEGGGSLWCRLSTLHACSRPGENRQNQEQHAVFHHSRCHRMQYFECRTGFLRD